MSEQTSWKKTSLQGSLREVQRVYQERPVVQVSLQLLLSIFTVGFFVFFAIRPTLGAISTLVKKLEDQQEVSEKLDTKVVQLSEAQELLITTGEELERLLEKAVPTEVSLDRLARQMEVLANQTGVSIVSMEVEATPLVGNKTSLKGDPKTKNGDLLTVSFSFTVGGSQTQLVQFLSDVENMERAIRLTEISLVKPEVSFKNKFDLVASAQAVAYYLPGEEQ